MGDSVVLTLKPEAMLAKMQPEGGAAPIPDATWYVGQQVGDGLSYRFAVGALAAARYLTADLLVDGNHSVAFSLNLQEGEKGPRFNLHFSALNQCQARMRVPLEAVDQNRWGYDREGAWLKPRCGGDRVDLTKVDRMTITISMKSDRPARFCLTPVAATADEPAKLTKPILPRGVLMDELGQSALHDWPAKSRNHDEVTQRLKAQSAAAGTHRFPDTFSKWGGCKALRFEPTGFFRTFHDGTRWWLVDPDGYAFWSAGMDCVRVNTDAAYDGLETALAWMPDREEYAGARHDRWGGLRFVNYLAANLIRAFGSDWYSKWSQIALGELRRLGFNTVANWSDWQIAKDAAFPYVRPLDFHMGSTPRVFRDFPDVFDPRFAGEAAEFAKQLDETKGDPAFIGYFLMNEPNWGFAGETPAAGMLFNTPSCHTRRALADHLKAKHSGDAALSAAWGMDVKLADIAEGEWTARLTPAALADLEAFSTVMVERLFTGLSDACKRVDPEHLNLGARYYTVPPKWALLGMNCFDVFSVNGYTQRIRPELEELSAYVQRPVMIGEWHFGALDVGLPASGIGHVRDQKARGQAYRVYLEDAASKPWCVGVHWFTLYDESALGRFDGENWNIGFLDVCNRPYEEIGAAARASHERLYEVAQGNVKPYDDAPDYLPLLFF
ncbi:MAG: hypothetical protein ACE149_06100 [Armatimonadota bacterium]